MGFKNIFSNGFKTTHLETAINCDSKMAYEVGYLGLPLYSFVLQEKMSNSCKRKCFWTRVIQGADRPDRMESLFTIVVLLA